MMPERTNSDLGVFEQLKPLYGSRIDRLWFAYNAIPDPRYKAELLRRLTLLSISVQEKRIGDRKIYIAPPKESVIGGGDYTIGTVVFPGLQGYPFTIYKEELLRHVFLLGPTGTGKTTLIIGILRQLLADGVPFMALDWKRNYRCLLTDNAGADVLVLTIGGDIAPLRLNILQPPSGVHVTEWAEALSDAISAGYLLMQGARNVLKEALLAAVRAHGTKATLRDALSILAVELKLYGRSRRYGWLESSYRSIEELTKGPFGDSLNEREHPMTFPDLLLRPVIFELEGLGQDQKKTFCVFLLQAVLLTRKKQHLMREHLHHALIFDEAHNVFPKERRDEPASVQTQLAREVREYGESIIAATQQTDVSDSIIANSGTKIFLRMDFPWDTRFVSDLLHIDPVLLTKIPDGHGIARLALRSPLPFLFRFPQQPIKNALVSDETVRQRYQAWREGIPAGSGSTDVVLGSRALALLADIGQYPFSTTTERYDRLGWNPKTGNTIKDQLLTLNLASTTTIEAGRSHRKILGLTSQGKQVLIGNGGRITPFGNGSIEHEYWRANLKTTLETASYTVTAEHDLGHQRYVDLHARRDERTLLIEVETGKSNIADNITKCHGYGQLILFFTSHAAYQTAQKAIPEHILTFTPDTIQHLYSLIK